MRKGLVLFLIFLSAGMIYASMHQEISSHKKVPHIKSKKSEVVLCTWNIAHYYAYKSARNMIDGPIFESKLKDFREIIYDSINADIISLNEYSSKFGVDKDDVEHLSSDVLFDGFISWFEGGATKKGVGHNAIYSNVRMGNFKKSIYKCNQVRKINTSHDYYYLSSDLYLNNKLVKFVCVYLIHSKKDPSLVHNQIAELIDVFKDEERVVMCGDFNTSNYSKFKKAGYSLANNGSIKTFYKTSKPLDNVIAKGVRISDVRIIKTELSDHYPLICHISL